MEENIEQIKYLLQSTTLSDRVKLLSFLAQDLEKMLAEGESFSASSAKEDESATEEKKSERASSGSFNERAGDTGGDVIFNSPVMEEQPLIGEIRMASFNFAPIGWAFCNGQMLPIRQYTKLFSVIGTYYGGNGQTTFALPDLRGRVPVHFGTGTRLSEYAFAQTGGRENVELAEQHMPRHSHKFKIREIKHLTDAELQANPTEKIICTDLIAADDYTSGFNPEYQGPDRDIETSFRGGSTPHENMPPYLACNFIIALEGIFPRRSSF